LFVESESGLWYAEARDLARDLARDMEAALCPDVCIRVMVIKTLWDLAHPGGGLTEWDDVYDLDD
jgi:hypothetical protein